MANSGLLPTFQISPASPIVQTMAVVATIGHRETFRDFRALLETHIDFAEIASWGPRAEAPDPDGRCGERHHRQADEVHLSP